MSRGAIFSRSVKYNLKLGTQSFKRRENNNHYLVRCVPTRHRHQARHRPHTVATPVPDVHGTTPGPEGPLARQTQPTVLALSTMLLRPQLDPQAGDGVFSALACTPPQAGERAFFTAREQPSSEQDAFAVLPAALPWQAPVRMLGMKPRRQGWGWAGHISQGWPQARPTVAQQSVLVQTIPLSCPWHIWLLTTVKHGPVL